MKTNNHSEVSLYLQTNDNFLIIPHVRPDGDALGSTFGLCQLLRENGKQADILLLDEVPDNYRPLLTLDYILYKDFSGFEKYKHLLLLDTSTALRIGLPEELPLDKIELPTVNIDHHPDNKSFGSIDLVDSEASATAEIILDVCKLIPEWQISPQVATYLMTGLVMDTGCFRFDNTDPHAMTAGSKLLELGADYHNIIKNMFFSSPLQYLQFQADIILNHLQLACDNRYAWVYLPPELLEKHQIDIKNIEGLIDIIRSIAGVEVAALLTQKDQGYKFSLRSKNKNYSVGKIARALNGGGHELAAGGFIDTTNCQKAQDLLFDHIKDLF